MRIAANAGEPANANAEPAMDKAGTWDVTATVKAAWHAVEQVP